MKRPRFEDYDIKVLAVLGNQTVDAYSYENIKMVMVNKMKSASYPVFYLINKFVHSENILKEVYAELIMISLYEREYDLEDDLFNEIVKLVSMDTLTYYGMELKSIDFRKKCQDEFWLRAEDIEDKIELRKKVFVDSPIYVKKKCWK